METLLRVATVNILNDLSRWKERRALLARGLGALAPDLVALQEVTDPLASGTAHWLAGELGGYSVHACPKSGRGSQREGVAVLSRWPVEAHDVLDLRSQRRVAQFVRVRAGGRPVVLVNGHFHWRPGALAARVRQVGLVAGRIKGLGPGTSVVACGDFNGTPGSPAIALMKRTLTSAHEAVHGREPGYTCPTPLVSGRRVRGARHPWAPAPLQQPARRDLAGHPRLHLRQPGRPGGRVRGVPRPPRAGRPDPLCVRPPRPGGDPGDPVARSTLARTAPLKTSDRGPTPPARSRGHSPGTFSFPSRDGCGGVGGHGPRFARVSGPSHDTERPITGPERRRRG